MSIKTIAAAALVVLGCPSVYAQAPALRVDPAWPRQLPDNWSVGPVSGIAVDARDHVWIVHRAEAVKQGTPAPHVVEFDPEGRVVQAWGPSTRRGSSGDYAWPDQVHGISIDHKDRVWISGNGPRDTHLVVFSRDGTFLRQIGQPGRTPDSNDTGGVGRATQMRFDPQANEVFVSDGENGNRRVVVFDSETGAYKRHWGAYGARPDDAAARQKPVPGGPPPQQFGSAVHCLRIARDGFVYVCDRANSRFQIFRKDGSFVSETFIAKELGNPSVWDIDFSPDQRFVYVADGGNQKLWVLRRDTHEVLTSIGGPGPAAGQFATSLHDIVVDSKGNLYTGEAATGGRVQKFAPQSGAGSSRTDRFPASGGDVEITPINHASVQIEHRGVVIHVDPWRQGDYSQAKPADLILITDTQSDHLDLDAIKKIRKPGAPVVIPGAAAPQVPDGVAIANGETKTVAGVPIEAVAAYDLKPGEPFHPKGRANGYILTLGGLRVYLAGVTECVPEVQAVKAIDVAFLSMNLPHERMTPSAAADCVKTFRPKVVYPYHYRDGDVAAFRKALEGEPIEVRLAEWYPARAR